MHTTLRWVLHIFMQNRLSAIDHVWSVMAQFSHLSVCDFRLNLYDARNVLLYDFFLTI